MGYVDMLYIFIANAYIFTCTFYVWVCVYVCVREIEIENIKHIA